MLSFGSKRIHNYVVFIVVIAMVFLWILVVVSLYLAKAISKSGKSHRVFEESKVDFRTDVTLLRQADKGWQHEVIFVVAPKNMDKLEIVLEEVSSTNSPKYGQHWNRAQIEQLTHNFEGFSLIVEFLNDQNIQIVKKSKYNNYIHAEASVETWQRVFQTDFHLFQVADYTSPIVRCLSLALPSYLHDHIQGVFNTVQFPAIDSLGKGKKSLARAYKTVEEIQLEGTSNGIYSNYVSPALINQYYNVTNNTATFDVSQAVYESLGQEMSPGNLRQFQNFFNLPLQNITRDIGGHANSTCTSASSSCDEANLDIQYIMAVAQQANTTFWYTNDWVFGWILSVGDSDFPSDVYSVSYGGQETGLEASYTNSFNNEAIKLGVMGVTILVASGDTGAPGSYGNDGTLFCGYNPQFPASSPYVTAVGATMGPESNEPEVGCQATPEGTVLITSGGGFSTHFGQPSWQKAAIATYFASVNGTSEQPYQDTSSLEYHYYSTYSDYITIPTYFNASGRGYPDVALLGHSYMVMIGESIGVLDGTSASTPVMAGFVTLVNHQRILAGASKMGFLNPFLYENAAEGGFIHDITSGNNKCTEAYDCGVKGCKVHCCNEGFYATTGWDPMTGLGSINYQEFVKASLMAVGISNAPTLRPSSAPRSSTPTVKHTPALSTDRPSFSPTLVPSQVLSPTVTPSLAPSHHPTIITLPPALGTLAPVTHSPVTEPPSIETRVPTLASSLMPVVVTTIPTKQPTEEPSMTPSMAPSTAMPLTLKPSGADTGIRFPVEQVISGLSASSYQSEAAANNYVIAETVAFYVPGTTLNTISVTSTVDDDSVSTADVPTFWSSFFSSILSPYNTNMQISSTDEIMVTYVVSIPDVYSVNYSSPMAAYNASKQLLTTAVMVNMQFSTKLNSNAVAQGRSNLNKATVSQTPIFGNYSLMFATTSNGTQKAAVISGGALAGIVIATVSIAGLCLALVLYYSGCIGSSISANGGVGVPVEKTASSPSKNNDPATTGRVNRFAGFHFDSENSQQRISELAPIGKVDSVHSTENPMFASVSPV